MLKGAIEEGNKEISPMFPRLHVKDAEKGGPKAPPRNKMALYEQFSIPSPQSFASGSSTTSLFPLPLRSCNVPSLSAHVGSNQSIQLCASNAPSFLAEKIQDYNSRNINLTKLMKGNFITNKHSLKAFDGEDDLITSSSSNGKNSCHSLVEIDKDEHKLADTNPSCSFKSLNAFKKKVNSRLTIELKLAQHGKNLMQDHSEMSQIGQKAEEGSAHTLDGLGDAADASLTSLVKGRNSKSMKKESVSLTEEIKCISTDSLKTHKGSSTFVDKIKLGDMEKLVASDVQNTPDSLEISERCLVGKRMRNKDEETYRHYDSFGKTDISPDDVLEVIGEKQFWKTRRTIINQQRIFFHQVFELHRLIEVQKLIAGSAHLLLEDYNLLLNKTPLKPPTFKKLHPDYTSERPSPVVKLESKSRKLDIAEHAKNNSAGKIPLPNCVNNISKNPANQVPSFPQPPPLAPLDISTTKQPPSCVYPPPPPPGNQWLVPVMSPSEGLVYKPITGPCPPNTGFIPQLYGSCSTMSFSPGNKDIPDTTLFPGPHQKIGTLYGASLPQFLTTMMHPSVSAATFEQMGQSSCPENRQSSPGEVSSAIMYRSLSNVACQTSQARNTTTYPPHSPNNTTTLPAKGDVLPLFPVAPTLWPSADHRTGRADDHDQPRVIKALPHNPKSATESAARIFRSLQEERKNL